MSSDEANAIEISQQQIQLLNKNIKKTKSAVFKLDANSNILNLLEELTATKESTLGLIGAYKISLGTDLLDDLKALSGNTDIMKSYVIPFINWGIVEKDYPFNLIIDETILKDYEGKSFVNKDSVSNDLANRHEPTKGWVFFKWVAIISSLVCFFGAIYIYGIYILDFGQSTNELEELGSTVDSYSNIGKLLFAWASIAGPSALIYYLSKED